MEQFSLEKWLQNKSRKVTTRLGNREVRIICWDRKNNNNRPIITLMIDHDGNEYTTFHTKNGFVDEKEEYIDKRDLFFADEGDELTEFEKELEMMMVSFSNGNLGSDVIKEIPKQKLHNYAHRLLDLARKKVLKDLPKWKKATKCKEFDKHVCVMDYYTFPFLDTEVNEGDYYIKLEDLKTLPKEE